MSLIEDKQIELAEKISNYNEILQFVKEKIAEEDLDRYLSYFDEKPLMRRKTSEESKESNTPGKIITMWGDEV
jgi:hypothetical protein